MAALIRWAPRVPMEWIQKLYETDAQGIVDDELVDKVGYRLYQRCKDCLLVSTGGNGPVHCPRCRDAVTGVTGSDLSCPACGWTSDWPTFHKSYRHMELSSGGMRPFFEQFITRWDAARTPKQKLLAIDDLIHRWHYEHVIAERGGVGRPGGVNLIEGSRKQVIAFLERLSAGPNKDRWDKHLSDVRDAQQAWRSR